MKVNVNEAYSVVVPMKTNEAYVTVTGPNTAGNAAGSESADSDHMYEIPMLLPARKTVQDNADNNYEQITT